MYIFPFIRIRYIKTITINTHIDCLNNSKCSVGDILLATKQGAFESVFGTFSVNPRFPPIFIPYATKFCSFISLQHKMSESESIISLRHKMSDDSDSDSDFRFGLSSPLFDVEHSTTAQEWLLMMNIDYSNSNNRT